MSKEFSVLRRRKVDEREDVRDFSEKINTKRFRPKSYQIFAKRYMSMYTTHRRVLLKYGTGSGKTPTSLHVAQSMLKYVDNVLVIGFSKPIFQAELLKYPDFGIVRRDQINRLEDLRIRSKSGNPDDISAYTDYRTSLRRMITAAGYSFYGYRTFFNRLLVGYEPEMSESDVVSHIKSGKITLDKRFVDRYRSCIVICDEIHNVYNSIEKNNWGVALQMFLDEVNPRTLLLTATPMTHLATEVRDLANLLGVDIPESAFNGTKITAAGRDSLRKLLAGKVLFVEDSDPDVYPHSAIIGERVADIPLLNFVECETPPNQAKAMAIESKSPSVASGYAMDMVFPGPDDKPVWTQPEIRALQGPKVTATMSRNMGIVIRGSILSQPELGKWSAKYSYLVDLALQNIREDGGKMMVYHRYVSMTGINLISEVFRAAGIIGEHEVASDNTIDVHSGLPRKEHERKYSEFVPARFVLITSDIDASVRERSIDMFTSKTNAQGYELMFLLGSEVIKESYDLKALRKIVVAHNPDNIGTLRQIFGRGKRYMSHVSLPPEDRTVAYYLLINSGESYERAKWRAMVEEYTRIQDVETVLHEIAADADLNYDIIVGSFAELGVRPFKPQVKWDDKNSAMYDSVYGDWELQAVLYIVKRLYMISKAWKVGDLIRAVRDPPFSTHFDTSVVREDTIYVAVYRLLWQNTPDNVVVLPRRTLAQAYDRVFNNVDRVISIDGQDHVLVQLGDYIHAVRAGDSGIMPDVESPYRTCHTPSMLDINLDVFVVEKASEINFESMLERLVGLMPINKDDDAAALMRSNLIVKRWMCTYDERFHELCARMLVEWKFAQWHGKKTGPPRDLEVSRPDYWDLIFISYVGQANIVTLSKLPTTAQEQFGFSAKMEHKPRDAILASLKKKDPSVLPVGVFFGKFYLYNGEWTQSDLLHRSWKDNDLVIGIIEKNNGVLTSFKIREPIKKVEDNRFISQGSTCVNKSKNEIIKYMRKLDIKPNEEDTARDLCKVLFDRLIELEVKERNDGTNIKYLYWPWE